MARQRPAALRVLGCDVTGVDHPVEAFEETLASAPIRQLVGAFDHRPKPMRYSVSLSMRHVRQPVMTHTMSVPKLWSETIETHRREVHEAILVVTAALVAEHGLRAVTMSQIAEETGIGRATLYKYFPDVETILVASHERHLSRHLDHFVELRDGAADAGQALQAVLQAYALIAHEVSHRHHQGSDLTALLHQGHHIARAQQRLTQFLRNLIAEGVKAGVVRDDVPPGDLANYCLHALAAAGTMPSKTAVRRLVMVTLVGLRPAARQG